MPRTRRRSLIAGAALLVAACGSDTSSAPAAAPPTSTTSTADSAPTTTVTSAPTTTSPTTTTASAPATTEPEPECRRLEDFDLDAGAWMIVNDGVMGGRSDGRGTVDDSTLRFFGNVVTAGGGFTSVRLRLDGTELDGTDRVRARVQLDDRTYGFTFEDDQAIQGRRVSHGADLRAPIELDGDGFGIVELSYTELRPTVFGQDVAAGPFDPDAASEIGIIIADGVDGAFEVVVDWIEACA